MHPRDTREASAQLRDGEPVIGSVRGGRARSQGSSGASAHYWHCDHNHDRSYSSVPGSIRQLVGDGKSKGANHR
jgi:hypothetical protein